MCRNSMYIYALYVITCLSIKDKQKNIFSFTRIGKCIWWAKCKGGNYQIDKKNNK